LPATSLNTGCYNHMFTDCSSLKEAPALPAKELSSYCYNFMFAGCESLQQVTMLAIDVLYENRIRHWLVNTAKKAKQAVFYKNKQAKWDEEFKIPSQWIVVSIDPEDKQLCVL